MELLALTFGTVVAIACALWGIRSARRRHDAGAQVVPAHGASLLDKGRPQTALGELRDMRDALGPAQHTRVERRRMPTEASLIAKERRGGRPR